MQAYTESKTELYQTFILFLSAKSKKRYLEGIILLVVKLLYNLAATGNH